MIKFHCPGCGQKLAVKDNLAGKRTKCPSCTDPVAIPHVSSALVGVSVAPEPVAAPNGPAFDAVPAPVVPRVVATTPFGFDSPSRASAGALETVPNVDLGMDLVPGAAPPRRQKRSPVKAWATWGAILGAALGAGLTLLLKLTDEHVVDALGRMLPKAGLEAIQGALTGTIGGLAIAGLLFLLAGRNGATIFGTLILVAGGGAYGGIRKASFSELEIGLTMPVLGALAGMMAGAILGAITGAIVSSRKDRRIAQPLGGVYCSV